MQRVLIIDTSILCVWLQVSGKTTCGSGAEQWNKERVDQELEREIQAGTTLVLPLATIIETGNHISQAVSQRYEMAQALANIMAEAADEKTPWAAFTDQAVLWDANGLKMLALEWAELASQKLSIGDATIKTAADYYARSGFEVEIFTGDKGLKAHQPSFPLSAVPKRRSQRRS
jgi:hypothetical protein